MAESEEFDDDSWPQFGKTPKAVVKRGESSTSEHSVPKTPLNYLCHLSLG